MLEVADIFRLHGPAYREKFAARILPSHLRAMHDIESCRTATRGGQLYFCHNCKEQRYSYHSCQNRHCPKCQNDQANQWLDQQQLLLLPVPYFMVTFTLPAELRPLARSHQKTVYNLLFRTASQALLLLAQDPRFVGATLGLVGVLQTWTRDLRYHPHLHFIVTGGGLTADRRWRSSRPHFLVPEQPLALLPRQVARRPETGRPVCASRAASLEKDWIVDCQPVGSGRAAFQYLAPYIFRVASLQQPPAPTHQWPGHFSVQRIGHSANQDGHPARREVHWSLPATRPFRALHQGALLRFAQPQASATARPGPATARCYHRPSNPADFSSGAHP
jgi:hypothetical protein